MQILAPVFVVAVVGGMRVVGEMDVLQVKCLKKEVVMSVWEVVRSVFVAVNIGV